MENQRERASALLERHRTLSKKGSAAVEGATLKEKKPVLGAAFYEEQQGGKPTGNGVLLYPDGSAYAGQMRRKKRHGSGTLFGKDGSANTSSWKKNKVYNPLWTAGVRTIQVSAAALVAMTLYANWDTLMEMKRANELARQGQKAQTTQAAANRNGEQQSLLTVEQGEAVLRGDASAAAKAVATTKPGAVLIYLNNEKKDGEGRMWYEVQTAGGKRGWVQSAQVAFLEKPQPVVVDANAPEQAPAAQVAPASIGSFASTVPAKAAASTKLRQAYAPPAPSPSPGYAGAGNGGTVSASTYSGGWVPMPSDSKGDTYSNVPGNVYSSTGHLPSAPGPAAGSSPSWSVPDTVYAGGSYYVPSRTPAPTPSRGRSYDPSYPGGSSVGGSTYSPYNGTPAGSGRVVMPGSVYDWLY